MYASTRTAGQAHASVRTHMIPGSAKLAMQSDYGKRPLDLRRTPDW